MGGKYIIVRWGHFSDLHFKGWGGFDTNILYKAELISLGSLDNCKIEEAFKLWDKVSKRNSIGYFEKGKFLYNNNEQKKGYNLIRQAYVKGNVEATLFIAQDNLELNKNFSVDLVGKLNKIMTMYREENRKAAALIYIGVKKQLIKKYNKYKLEDLYHFAYDVFDVNTLRTQAFEYYDANNCKNAFYEFEKTFINGYSSSAVEMAYMLRKGEVKSDKYTVRELLTPLVDTNNSLAVVNYSLEIIQNSSNQ